MKTKNPVTRYCSLLALVLLQSITSISQSPPSPEYSFTSPVLLSGTLNAVGSVYRYSNVKAGVDAIVTITNAVNATVAILDQTAAGGGGYDAAFQPSITIAKLTTGYVDFNIDFVATGTFTPVLQSGINITALDIDGYNYAANQQLYEFEQFDMGTRSSVYYYFDGTDLSFSYVGSAIRATNVRGVDYGSINLSQNVRFTMYTPFVSNIKVHSGAINGDQFNNVTRQRSFYFARFSYSNMGVLAANDLQSFSGKVKDNTVQLNWELAPEHKITNVEVERSTDNHTFEKITAIDPSGKKDFSFIDKTAGKGNNYYRLRLCESNGNYSYSNVLKIIMENLGHTSFMIYPAVVSSKATLSVTSGNACKGTLIIADAAGRVFLRKSIDIFQGISTLNLPELASLQPGNYIVVLNTGTEKLTQKIIIAGK